LGFGVETNRSGGGGGLLLTRSVAGVSRHNVVRLLGINRYDANRIAPHS
jgi:hypothetical protein